MANTRRVVLVLLAIVLAAAARASAAPLAVPPEAPCTCRCARACSCGCSCGTQTSFAADQPALPVDPQTDTARRVTPADTAQLAQLERSQRLQRQLLEALADSTVTAGTALQLLRDAAALREALLPGGAAAQRVQAARERAAAPQPGPSRGILIVAGGHDQLRNAAILLQLLRHPAVNCILPVEVVYYGAHEADGAVLEAMQQHAHDTGSSLTLLDGSTVAPSAREGLPPHRAHAPTSFRAKVHALAWVTTFEQVLLLDSDNTPLADPAYLFESREFREHGVIAWPDFWHDQWMRGAVYGLLGLDAPWVDNPAFRATESGQLVLNRARHADVLEWLWLLNTHSNSGGGRGSVDGVVGACLWGDKDTYRLAFAAAGKARDFFQLLHAPLQALSRPGGATGRTLEHAGMAQRGLRGELLVLHRTAAGKFFPHCALRGGATCDVWALTAPVGQRQLLASVADPSDMRLDASQVDEDWQERHCAAPSDADHGASCTAPAAGGGGAGSCGAPAAGGGRLSSAPTALACDLGAGAGLLPIPVVHAKRLPVRVREVVAASHDVFERMTKAERRGVN